MTILFAVVAWLSGSYLLALALHYFRGTGSVQRHHLESIAFIFVATLVSAAIAQRREQLPEREGEIKRPITVAALVAIAAALVLYAPVIGSGRFADDFVLLDAVRRGRWTVWSDLFRPAIFLVWRLLDSLLDDPSPLLHLTNILLHGVNTAMVLVLAMRLQLSAWTAGLAAALFLTFPASVEAVVWPSGFQDVGMTTLVLMFLLIVSHARQSLVSVIAAVAVALLACLTKETAVVAPVLAGLVMYASTRRNWKAVGASALAVAAFVAIRSAFMPLPVANWWRASRYVIKEFLVRPFASLLVPFRIEEIAARPLVTWGLVAFVVVSLCVAASRWTKGDDRLRSAAVCAAFVIASIAPVFPFFFVTDDLQGSRYLYLASVAWAVLLARLYSGGRGRWSVVGGACAVLTLAVWVSAARAHQRPWLAGADTRERVLAALGSVSPECSRSAVYGLPKVIDGVPIFLNGFAEAARERAPAYVFRFEPSVRENDECRLVWNGVQLQRE